MLSEEQKAAYLKASHKCPYCGSEDLEGGFVEIDFVGANQVMRCHSCQAKWYDVYTLTGIVEDE